MNAIAMSISFCWPYDSVPRGQLRDMLQAKQLDHLVGMLAQSGVGLGEQPRRAAFP